MQMWAKSVLDRAARSGLQVLLAYLSVAELIGDVAWTPALSAAGIAVVASLLTSTVSMPSFGEAWGFQLAERAVKTFAQSLAAGIGTATMFEQVDWRAGFSAAVLATVYSLATSVLTTRLGPEATVGNVDVSAPPRHGQST